MKKDLVVEVKDNPIARARGYTHFPNLTDDEIYEIEYAVAAVLTDETNLKRIETLTEINRRNKIRIKANKAAIIKNRKKK